jgi:hypothetical protein
MALRRSSRLAARPAADPKPSAPTLGKTKVNKPVAKKAGATTNNKTAAKKAAAADITNPVPFATPRTSTLPIKNFPCACRADCAFKTHRHQHFEDRRVVLGQPEEYEHPAVECTCKVHLKCAIQWAHTHDALPDELPCGCPLSWRGAGFWKLQQKKERKEQEKKKVAEDEFDSGSELTDIED